METFLSAADRHAVVDAYWSAKIDALSDDDPISYYACFALLDTWKHEKQTIDNSLGVKYSAKKLDSDPEAK